MTRSRVLIAVATVLAVVFAVWKTLAVWEVALQRTHGADFASYYWAWMAADAGHDPYVTRNLTAMASAAGPSRAVHPFFYPPPFLLCMVWVQDLTVTTAYRLWFWIDALAALGCAALLALGWRDVDRRVPWLAVMAVLTMSAVPNNHAMGQVNLPVLFVVLAGLWAGERDRPVVAGVLLGVACMAKMSPAFFVAWWLLRGRFTAAAVSIATAVGLSVAALLIVPLDTQVRFYTEVLPGFGTGDYNGLRVPISLWGNYSIPELYEAVWPGQDGALSATARRLSTLTMLTVIGGLGLAFSRRAPDAFARFGQIGAVSIALLLVPVYTYEHHLVYAIPAAVAVVSGTASGRLPRWTMALWLTAWVVVAFDLQVLRTVAEAAPGVLSVVLREAKLASLGVLFGGAIALGRSETSTQR